ncbi:MAG: Rieske (2Fe-2S) protein [Chloroflexi bacterium]|nr:MAG: Rieske (2Fe-2S) protein [Chloroflexota bacterium]
MLTSSAFTAGQFWLWLRNLWRSEASPAVQEIARVDDIPVGGSLLFEYPAHSPARLLVRVDEETFVAYEQQCTHLLCPVIPNVERGELHCPCHDGHFDLMSGRPLAGPPQRPLARVNLEVRDGVVYATGIEERTV